MNTILYGNLRVEVLHIGGRVDRLTLPQARPRIAARLITPTETPLVLFGRDAELVQLRIAVRGRRPIEINATCGYGKTTLLRQLAAAAVADRVPSAYLQVGADQLQDLLTRLVDTLYTVDQRVKFTSEQCAQLLSQAQALIMLDDVVLDAEQVYYLISILPGCSLVLSCPQSVLGRRGFSHTLSGLPDEAALQLVTTDLGRPLTRSEADAVRRLAAAVDGQPLHLRQASALVREGHRSFDALAEKARREPEILDRLSVNTLAVAERRALAVLALAGGAMLPAQLVGAMGDVAEVAETLGVLYRRGLAEQRVDRFGLSVCKVDGYRKLLLDDLHLGAAVRELINWFVARDPTTDESISAADAALSVISWAAERRDWRTVVQLVQVVEPVLTLAGRWEASRRALADGLQAGHATADAAAVALFSHQLGTLALCLDELTDAKRLLEHALALRVSAGDRDGAAVTRHNLDILQPPAPPPPPSPRPHRAGKIAAVAGTSLVLLIALIVGIINATAGSHPPSQPAAIPTSSGRVTSGNSLPSTGAATTGTGSANTAADSNTAASSASATTTSASTTAASTSAGSSSAQVFPATVPKLTDFGLADITSGTAPVNRTVTVSNPNAQPLSLAQTGISGDPAFAVTADDCSNVTVPPQGSCVITVAFTPTTLGDHQAALAVIETTGHPPTAELTGRGYVNITVVVTGPGTVRDPNGLVCPPPACTEQVTAVDTLTATPDPVSPNSVDTNWFYQWGDACSSYGREPTCFLGYNLNADETVSATFLYRVG